MQVIFASTLDSANTAFQNPTKGAYGPQFTPPEITNLGYGGTITSGSPAFYPSGGGSKNYLLWVNSGNTITNRWLMESSSALDTALVNIGIALEASEASITLYADGTYSPTS